LAPNALDSLVVHYPASPSKQITDSAIAIATELARQVDDLPSQSLIQLGSFQLPSLRRTHLSDDSTRSTL
jgi:hypothetical protein